MTKKNYSRTDHGATHRPQARGVCLWRLKRLSLCCAGNSSYWLALFIYLLFYLFNIQNALLFLLNLHYIPWLALLLCESENGERHGRRR